MSMKPQRSTGMLTASRRALSRPTSADEPRGCEFEGWYKSTGLPEETRYARKLLPFPSENVAHSRMKFRTASVLAIAALALVHDGVSALPIRGEYLSCVIHRRG